jgi:translation initiation factor 3 subunit L
MIALLAILSHVCPPVGLLDEAILRTIRDNHGSLLNKIDSGEKEYDELFTFASPKFISPVVGGDNYKLQIKRFRKEMESQQKCRKLRSYMKLYTSLEVSKLAAFTDCTEDEMIAFLLSYKHHMNQLEEGSDSPKSALDIHYYVVNSTVQVDEPEKQRRFENYFMQQIGQNAGIQKDIVKINTRV